MTTTKLKEQLKEVINELRDVLPPDKTHLASQVHDLFVSYRRTCAELRRNTEEAQSLSQTASQQLKDAQSEFEETARKLADVERTLAKTEQKQRQGPQNSAELTAVLRALSDQLIPFAEWMDCEVGNWPSPSDVLLSLSAQLQATAWFLNQVEIGIDLRKQSPNERLATQNFYIAVCKIADIQDEILVSLRNAMALSESSGS